MFNKRKMQVSLILLSIFMISFGVYRKEAYVVLSKAIRICLECVGIGWYEIY